MILNQSFLVAFARQLSVIVTQTEHSEQFLLLVMIDFLGLHLYISNDIVSIKIYNKRDDLILKLLISHF